MWNFSWYFDAFSVMSTIYENQEISIGLLRRNWQRLRAWPFLSCNYYSPLGIFFDQNTLQTFCLVETTRYPRLTPLETWFSRYVEIAVFCTHFETTNLVRTIHGAWNARFNAMHTISFCFLLSNSYHHTLYVEKEHTLQKGYLFMMKLFRLQIWEKHRP